MAVSMAEAHERANRHPKYKTSCRIKNWQEYEKSLRKRGDIPFCNCRDQRSSKRERIGYILDGCQSYSKIESIRLAKKKGNRKVKLFYRIAVAAGMDSARIETLYAD
jgi:hypothetical protein